MVARKPIAFGPGPWSRTDLRNEMWIVAVGAAAAAAAAEAVVLAAGRMASH